MTARLLPDLDDELTAALAHIEELLLVAAAWEGDEPGTVWPAPLARQAALEAVRRTWQAVAPTQGERAAAGGRILAPDGRYEHIPLRLVDIGQDDIDTLAAAARVFGDPLAPPDVREVLENGAEITYGGGGDAACTRLVVAAAQLAGLLDLAPDQDSAILAALVKAGAGSDVTLTPGAEAAYQRYAGRANRMWTLSDPLARYLY